MSVYLDSSALVKLVIDEPESEALRGHLRRDGERVSCALARVEVVRAVLPHGPAATTRARALLGQVSLVRLDDALLDAAGRLGAADSGDAARPRSLDAIHLAAAQSLEGEVSEMVTYDRRMARAAMAVGLAVESPGAAVP